MGLAVWRGSSHIFAAEPVFLTVYPLVPTCPALIPPAVAVSDWEAACCARPFLAGAKLLLDAQRYENDRVLWASL